MIQNLEKYHIKINLTFRKTGIVKSYSRIKLLKIHDQCWGSYFFVDMVSMRVILKKLAGIHLAKIQGGGGGVIWEEFSHLVNIIHDVRS